MKIELHLHTNRYSGCAVNSPQEMMRELVRCGYDAVFITEHDSVWPDHELAELQESFPDIHIFKGVELSFSNSAHHLLVLGSNDPDYLVMNDEAAVLHKAQSQGHLTILGHPFRYGGGAEMLKLGLFPDAIECLTCNQSPEQAQQARDAAARYGLHLVNAGDSHSVEFIDKFWIKTLRQIRNGPDLRDVILEGKYRNCSADNLVWS